MRTRLLTPLFVLIFILALAVAPAARAQDTGVAPECFNLPADDCAFLLAALTKTSQTVTSFHQTLELQLSLSGWMGQSGANDLTLSVKGEGPFVIDPAAALQDPLAAVSAMLDMQAVSSGGGQSMGSTIDVRYVDATGYWMDPTTGQWLGLSADDVMAIGMMAMGLAAQPDQIADLIASAPGMTGLNAMGGAAAAKEAMDLGTSLMSADMASVLPTPSFVVNYQRQKDVEMMGQTLSPFSLDLDLAPLLASEQFQTFLAQALTAAGQRDQDASLLMAAQMVPAVLNNSSVTLNVTLWIGKDDMILRKVTTDLQAAVDINAVMGLGEATAEPATVNVQAEVTLDRINESLAVSAPEHATMLAPIGLGEALMP